MSHRGGDEAAAIADSVARGAPFVYYRNMACLPSIGAQSTVTTHRSTASSLTEAYMTSLHRQGDYTFLPHPGYAGMTESSRYKGPLYKHTLISSILKSSDL